MGRGLQPGLRFGLLGPPILYDGQGDPGPGVQVVGSRKLRILLAALLLEAGRVVSAESLKDALWGSTPPASARASLHNHVSRLRRLLDDPGRLRAVGPGYLLRVEPGELDVQVFEARVAAARAAHADGDWPCTVRSCAAAFALWRGAPLAGLPSELAGYAMVQRMEEARLLLLEWRYDAELAVPGARPAALVPELAALAAEHPLREAFHRQLMLALHRTGRQAEALAVHRDLRTRLVEELGVEPGPAVREAHVEVLREGTPPVPEEGAVSAAPDPSNTPAMPTDPAADSSTAPAAAVTAAANVTASPDATAPTAPSTTTVPSTPTAPSTPTVPIASSDPNTPPSPPPPTNPAPTAPAPPDPPPLHPASDTATREDPAPPGTPLRPARPAQLPPPPGHFTGRFRTREHLRRTLDPVGRPSVALLSGMAGVGKSALALHVAHGLRERFPDGQLYVNLHGATPGMTPLTPAQALTALLRDLGADPRAIPEHQDAAAALLRSLLAPTRTLMLLDDAASAAQVRPLLPAGGGCAVIVTSRSPLTALDDVHRFPLAPLTAAESAELLRRASGRDNTGPGDPTSTDPTSTDASSTDLTSTDPTPTPTDAHHIDPTHPLVELTGRLPLALRVVAARLAARRALTPDVLADQLAAAEDRLHHLEYDDLSVRRSLAVAHDALAASGRRSDRDAALALRRIGALDLPGYGVPLVARLLGTDETRAEDALDRLVDVALLEETAYGRYAPHDLVRDFARELTDARHAPDLARTALRWYAAVAERALTAIVEPGPDQDDRRRPTTAQPPEHAAHVLAIAPFPTAEKAYAWCAAELENIVALAKRHADTPDDRTAAHVSTLLRLLAPFLQRSGRVAETELLGRTALKLARRLGDEAAEGYALGDLAALHHLTGRHGDALALNDRALAIWRRLGAVSRTRRCLDNRGLLLGGLGRYTESGEALRQSLALSRRLGDPFGEAVTLSHLGNLYEHTDPRSAMEQHRRSLAIGEEIGSAAVRHTAHRTIGHAHLRLGEPAAAVGHFEESLRILGRLGDWHGESRARLGLVRARRLLGHAEAAAAECAELLRRADARADRYTGALARHQHGLLLHAQGRAREAYEAWRAALDALDGTDETALREELRDLLGDSAR